MRKFLLFSFLLVFAKALDLEGAADTSGQPAGGAVVNTIPVTFDLPQADYITLVAEDAQGNRAANLLSDVYLPAGRHQVNWDGLDVGVPLKVPGQQGEPQIVRHRIQPGTYHLRGLVHNGLHMIYEFPVYTSGNPPWFTASGSGGWLTDHDCPCAVLLLPPGSSPYGDPKSPQLLLSSEVAEDGSALMWADLSGQKLMGLKMGGWYGGLSMARDTGDAADPAVAAYSVTTGNSSPKWGRGTYTVWQINKDGSTAKVHGYSIPNNYTWFNGYPKGPDIAVHNGIAVVSDIANDALVLFDVKNKAVLGTIAVPSPTGVAFDNQGALYVLTNRLLKRYQLDVSARQLSMEQVIVSQPFDDPQRILLAADRIYVSDWGKSHQVKVYDASGRSLGTIGEAGGPQTGPYDESRMHFPLGMALDPQGQLWVMERDWLPKRISVWSSTGKFVKAFYGPTQYGGGGMIDPQDKDSFYYGSNMSEIQGGMKFKLDWQAGAARLTDVYMRGPAPLNPLLNGGWPDSLTGFNVHTTFYNSYDRTYYPYDLPRSGAPERAIHYQGKLYLTNAFNGWERYNSSNGIFEMQKDGTIKPVAVAGPVDILLNRWALFEKNLRDFDAIKAALKAKIPDADLDSTVFVWSDLNGDGFIEPDELQFKTMEPGADGKKPKDTYSGMYVDDQLRITTSYALQLTPVKFSASGVPIYDLSHAKRLADLGGGQPVPGRDGWLVNGLTGYKDGQKKWNIATYGYHYVPQSPSEIVNPTRLLGPTVTPVKGNAGEMFAISGEKGSAYLVTMDGLFVQNLGGDVRTTPLVRFPEAKRGMDIIGHSWEDEEFHPTIEQLADGEIYVVAGKEYTAIYHLEGLETVKRLDFGEVVVTDSQLAGIPETQTEIHERRDNVALTVSRVASPPALDGTDGWVLIDNRTMASLAICGDRLYASYRTGDPDLLENSGASDSVLFKSGGGLDLMLRESQTKPTSGSQLADGIEPIEGDLRLFVTRVKGQTKAMLYRPVVPGTSADSRTTLSSPIGDVTFDAITDVSNQVQITADGKGGYQFSIPLSAIDWNPVSGRTYRGDLGVLRGNGSQTVQRSYWSNTTATIVSDVPSEARLQPMNWGKFKVQ